MSAALQRAESLLDVGRPAEAADQLGRHLATSPDDAYALCLLGRAHLGMADPAGALQVAGRAAALAPAWEWPHRIASIALDDLGRNEEAVRAAREAVRLEPDGWRTHVQLALALSTGVTLTCTWRDGERRPSDGPSRGVEAWEAASRAVQLDPQEPRTHQAIGTVALAGGHLDVAERAFRAALALDPESPEALNDLGLVQHRRGDLATAATGFAAAAAADPTEPAAAYNVVLVGWGLLSRLLLVLFGLAFLVVGVGGSAKDAQDAVPSAVFGPFVLAVLAVLAAFCVATLRRLPRPVRGVLARAVRRGWALPASAAVAGGVALLAAAPWPPLPETRGGLAATAMLLFAVGGCCALAGTRAHVQAFARRHGR